MAWRREAQRQVAFCPKERTGRGQCQSQWSDGLEERGLDGASVNHSGPMAWRREDGTGPVSITVVRWPGGERRRDRQRSTFYPKERAGRGQCQSQWSDGLEERGSGRRSTLRRGRDEASVNHSGPMAWRRETAVDVLP